jgi:hypothetical protein
MLTTYKELTDHIASIVRDTQIEVILQRTLNLTLGEIWTFSPWTFKRRKQTFATVADYNLDAEVDEIRLLRLRSTPRKLVYVPDHIFYELQADPEGTGSGTPWAYRLWEETGFATNLAAADTVYVSSSSTSDGSAFTVRIVGRNSSGEVVAETLTLNGTSNVTSSTTWAAAGLMQISKSATTTGTITCYRTTGATQLTEIAPEETAPRYKRLSLYPIPSSALTMYLEYDERLRFLSHATDVPQMDHKWMWVAIEGTLAKVWGYKQNDVRSQLSQALYEKGLFRMRTQDLRNLDYVPVIRGAIQRPSIVKKFNDSVSNNFPSYGVGW